MTVESSFTPYLRWVLFPFVAEDVTLLGRRLRLSFSFLFSLLLDFAGLLGATGQCTPSMLPICHMPW